MKRRLCSILLLASAACHSAQPLGIEPPETDACAELLAAQPQDWPRHLPAVMDEGRSATAHLVAGLEQDPGAPGAQAAIAALGSLGDPHAGPTLERLVRRREPHAPDAALSLGRLPHPSSADLLRSTAHDPRADATLRTACACAMVELGRGGEVLDLLRAVLLAGTPQGEGPAGEMGLPRRSRWALERHMIILAVRHRFGDDLGLDTDSPWPRLVEGVEALTRMLRDGESP